MDLAYRSCVREASTRRSSELGDPWHGGRERGQLGDSALRRGADRAHRLVAAAAQGPDRGLVPLLESYRRAQRAQQGLLCAHSPHDDCTREQLVPIDTGCVCGYR